ncbi:hypothetical protein PV328_012191, partial [Microctonus aethiopoides]
DNNGIGERAITIHSNLEPKVVIRDIMKDAALHNVERDIDGNNSEPLTSTCEQSINPPQENGRQTEIGVIEHRSSEDAGGIRVVETIDNDSAAINIRNKWKLSRFWCKSNKKRVRVLKLNKSKSERVMFNDEEISDDIENISSTSSTSVEIITEKNDQCDSDDTFYGKNIIILNLK